MIDARGTVVSVEGEFAVVKIDSSTGCGRCHEPGGCGGANIATMLCTSSRTFRVLNPGQSQVGDVVSVVTTEGAVHRGALWAYIVPLALLLIGALGGSRFGSEQGAMLGALIGLAASFCVLRYLQRKLGASRQFLPHIRM